MKRYSLLLIFPMAFCMAWIPYYYQQTPAVGSGESLEAYKSANLIRCTPDWDALREVLEESDIPPIPGSGNYKWGISTSSDSAQFYFNQGINMYYGFHIIEAMASFKKASRFDPECALLYWAQALAYGPNINDYGYRASPDALAATEKARSLKGKASPFEQALIDAISIRYTADSGDATRASLNQDYTDFMKAVALQYASNPDAQALYADAMMLQHPWDLWTPDGRPKPWTPAIRAVLEKLLEQSPMHPGANHYYVHVMEPSPEAAKALPSARRLETSNPGLSHMVHMPSHIYLRVGDYEKGVTVNTVAVNSYQRSIPLYAAVTGADFLYLIHNLHMQANNAMMMANFSLSVKSGNDTRYSMPKDYLAMAAPFGSLLQYIYMTPVFVNIRFGQWKALLNEPAPGNSYVYATLLYHFGRGMAFAKTGNPAAARQELKQMETLLSDSSLTIAMIPFSPPVDGARVAKHLLAGTIALQAKNFKAAVGEFSAAVKVEEEMVYNEPRDWLLNPKPFLGQAYLQSGDPQRAVQIFSKDLEQNQDNCWSLLGLSKALEALGKKEEANNVKSRFQRAAQKADVQIQSPVY